MIKLEKSEVACLKKIKRESSSITTVGVLIAGLVVDYPRWKQQNLASGEPDTRGTTTAAQ